MSLPKIFVYFCLCVLLCCAHNVDISHDNKKTSSLANSSNAMVTVFVDLSKNAVKYPRYAKPDTRTKMCNTIKDLKPGGAGYNIGPRNYNCSHVSSASGVIIKKSTNVKCVDLPHTNF